MTDAVTTVYLTDSPTSTWLAALPKDTLLWPENGKDGKALQGFAKSLELFPATIFTQSLYLIREIELNGIKVKWINDNAGQRSESCNVADLGPIEILDRELEQSDRYLQTNWDILYDGKPCSFS